MAGTVAITHASLGHVRKVFAACTADAADGSFPATAIPSFEGRLLAIVTNPGAVAPQDNYDVTLVNQHGYDVLQGLGANRDTTNTEQVPILYLGTSTHPAVAYSDVLTLTIAGNNVNSAITQIELYYALGA